MGLLVDGIWKDEWYDTDSTGGKFERSESQVRNWVTTDGSPGPTGEGGFKAEHGRYHLYVSLACPWAHRTLIFRALKGLTESISVSVVHPVMLENGWTFGTDFPGATGDTVNGKHYLYELYQHIDASYTGRVTVPLLWDKQQNKAVSNESADIIRMLNHAFDGIGAAELDLYPAPLRDAINTVNARIYDRVNNGVYQAGFATQQAPYEEAVDALFSELDALEAHLANNRYLVGNTLTEADWRLFTTLARFDSVYVSHFKCNRKRLLDYPNLHAYARELYQWQGVKDTVNQEHIKGHYYRSHPTINPAGIIPVGFPLELHQPHGRESITGNHTFGQ